MLSEKENAAIIGSAVDELIRHHPSLKDRVFDAIGTVLGRIEELGNTFVEEKDTENMYRLVIVGKPEVETKMDVVESSDDGPQAGPSMPLMEPADAVSEPEQGKHETTENIIVAYVDVVARVRTLLLMSYMSWFHLLFRHSSSRVFSSTIHIVGISSLRLMASIAWAGSSLCHACRTTMQVLLDPTHLFKCYAL